MFVCSHTCFVSSITLPLYFPCAGHSFQCLTQAHLFPPHHNPEALAQGCGAGTVDPSWLVIVCTWPCSFSVDQQCKVTSVLCSSPSSPPSPWQPCNYLFTLHRPMCFTMAKSGVVVLTSVQDPAPIPGTLQALEGCAYLSIMESRTELTAWTVLQFTLFGWNWYSLSIWGISNIWNSLRTTVLQNRNLRYQLLKMHCFPGSLLRPWRAFSHLILVRALWSGYCFVCFFSNFRCMALSSS